MAPIRCYGYLYFSILNKLPLKSLVTEVLSHETVGVPSVLDMKETSMSSVTICKSLATVVSLFAPDGFVLFCFCF